MAIVGEKPERGLRVLLDRSAVRRYDGTVATADAVVAVACAIDEGGDVVVTGELPEAVRDKVRLIVRSALRHADAGDPLPMRIHRWRGDK